MTIIVWASLQTSPAVSKAQGQISTGEFSGHLVFVWIVEQFSRERHSFVFVSQADLPSLIAHRGL